MYVCVVFFVCFNSKTRFTDLLSGCVLLSHVFWSGGAYLIYETPSMCNGKPFYIDLVELKNNPSILIVKIHLYGIKL